MKCKLIIKAYLDKAIINVKHPKTSVTKAKIGKVIEANCKRCSLKNTNNVVEKKMIKLLKMAKIEDKIRTQIKDEVDLDMMVIKLIHQVLNIFGLSPVTIESPL